MTLTLYYSPGACSLAPHIVLEELGARYALELVSARDGSTQAPAYRAINPKARVPALRGVAGRSGGADEVLTEAPAILLYLARAHPGAGLLPADPAAEARCLEWLNFLSSTVHGMSYGQIWRPQRFVADARDFPAVTAQGRRNVEEQYAYIEAVLADGRDWAVPQGYSIADPFLLVFYHWGGRIELDMRRYPAWRRVTQRMLARPAVRRALAQEKIEIG
jgi:glutathione S-transferase